MPSLTSQQLEAIQALSSGRSVTATAEALGIHRTTLHHWSRTIPEFRDTLEAVKQARIDATRDAVRNRPSSYARSPWSRNTSRFTIDPPPRGSQAIQRALFAFASGGPGDLMIAGG